MEGHPPEQPDRVRPSAAVRRYNVERSYLRCHERKVRCDKVIPCSTCLRAKATCRYPGAGRTKRWSQRMFNAKVGARLEVLERTVAAIYQTSSFTELAHNVRLGQARRSDSPTSTLPPEAVLSAADQGVLAKHREGFLVKEGTSTRYVNEVLFSGVLEKVSAFSKSSPSRCGLPLRAGKGIPVSYRCSGKHKEQR